ncbi:MAG: hypothetical protein ACOVLC_05725 [Flavobacterium sp.]
MRPRFFIIYFLFVAHLAMGQNLYLEIKGTNTEEDKLLQTISIQKEHKNYQSVLKSVRETQEFLYKSGFIFAENIEQTKKNDSTFVFTYNIGRKIKEIYVHLESPNNKDLLVPDFENDTIKLSFENLENTLQRWLSKLENAGFSLSKIQLIDYRAHQNHFVATLKIESTQKRNFNQIVVNGFPKFPKSHLKQLERRYRNKTFNQTEVRNLHNDINRFNFVSQFKYPEILFTTDSTDVYVYLAKATSNKFEGFLGFGNDENSRVIFNGYLDLGLNNIFNTGEKTSIYWKSDGREQTTFNIATELPYIFQTSFALKASLNLFKQDSTFQNTKTNVELGYLFSYNKRAYLGYQSSSSNDIQNTNSNSLQDFKNSFVTQSFEYTQNNVDDLLFREQTFLEAKIGFGNRTTATEKTSQQLFQLKGFHLFYLNKNNIIFLKTENYMLVSDAFFTNELYRFGGINSIRGFNENSLQASVFTSLMTEYRLKLGEELYLHSLLDYGYFNDQVTALKGNLLSFGFGLGLRTKNGLFNLVYANGATENQAVKLSNAIVHISFTARF